MSLIVFNGTVIRGQPDHANLHGARFVEEVRTAAKYRLFSIRDRYPAMIRAEEKGASVAAEMYDVPDEATDRCFRAAGSLSRAD